MAKHKPYIIHDHLTVQEIVDLINRAYEEGYEDGKAEATVIHEQTITTPWITTPLRDIQTTPTEWPPNTIYCGNNTSDKTATGNTV